LDDAFSQNGRPSKARSSMVPVDISGLSPAAARYQISTSELLLA